jgi:hypothetical protein
MAQEQSLDTELSSIERSVRRQIDPGPTALTVSISTLVLMLTLVLPWSGSVLGWQILVGTDAALALGPFPRLFLLLALAFGLVVSAAALATRWWPLAWLGSVGCGFTVVTGVWAIWSRQSLVLEGGTPAHIGMVLAAVTVVVLAGSWVRISLRR